MSQVWFKQRETKVHSVSEGLGENDDTGLGGSRHIRVNNRVFKCWVFGIRLQEIVMSSVHCHISVSGGLSPCSVPNGDRMTSIHISSHENLKGIFIATHVLWNFSFSSVTEFHRWAWPALLNGKRQYVLQKVHRKYVFWTETVDFRILYTKHEFIFYSIFKHTSILYISMKIYFYFQNVFLFSIYFWKYSHSLITGYVSS